MQLLVNVYCCQGFMTTLCCNLAIKNADIPWSTCTSVMCSTRGTDILHLLWVGQRTQYRMVTKVRKCACLIPDTCTSQALPGWPVDKVREVWSSVTIAIQPIYEVNEKLRRLTPGTPKTSLKFCWLQHENVVLLNSRMLGRY